jgi:SRSO17 transposase
MFQGDLAMDRSFEKRRRELEMECEIPEDLFPAAFDRLEDFMKPFVASFRRHEQVSHATTFVQGLCSDLECKNSESIAYQFGLERKTIQHFIGESAWDDAALRNELVRQVANELGEPDGVIVLDPSTFPKSGQKSVGVSRQWCGRLGKVENCQVGVYLAYVSSQGHALVDFELHLPKEWIADKKRMQGAGVPKDRQRGYRTRQENCLDLLDRCASKLPHTWVTADDEFGRPAGFREALRERNERYLLAVPCNTKIRDLGTGECDDHPPVASQRADRWTAEREPEEWTTIVVRDGEKGPITVQAIKTPVETGSPKYDSLAREVFVVIRYQDRDSKVVKTDYYLSNAELETPLREFCRAAKAEHRIEECIQRGKSETGMADYEVRNWIGWHHHQTLSLVAAWFLLVETRRAEKKDAGDYAAPTPPRHRRDSTQGTRMRFTPRRQMAY